MDTNVLNKLLSLMSKVSIQRKGDFKKYKVEVD
jgi:hypothetical protein